MGLLVIKNDHWMSVQQMDLRNLTVLRLVVVVVVGFDFENL